VVLDILNARSVGCLGVDEESVGAIGTFVIVASRWRWRKLMRTGFDAGFDGRRSRFDGWRPR